MAPGIQLQAYGSGHMAPDTWLRHTQKLLRVHRLVLHDAHVGDPTVPTPVCAQRLVNREVDRCVLRIAICYENVACVAFGCKVAVKHVRV